MTDSHVGRVPRIGRAQTSSAEELTEVPGAKLLGTIDTEKLQRTPSFEEDGPPPWEVDPKYLKHNTDARKFVDVPDTWELRWLAPKRIDAAGFRDWQTVSTSDSRVKLKVPAMRTPDNLVRRGGQTGDLLCYMPKHWVESRRRITAEKAARQRQAGRDRNELFKEEMNRGHFGRHQRVTDMKTPVRTEVEGRSLDTD